MIPVSREPKTESAVITSKNSKQGTPKQSSTSVSKDASENPQSEEVRLSQTDLGTPPLIRIRRFLASPVVTRFHDQGSSEYDAWVTQLSTYQKKVLGGSCVGLLLLLIVLTLWVGGYMHPKIPGAKFKEKATENIVQMLCGMRPPLTISGIGKNDRRQQYFNRLLCLSIAVFHMRYGVAETPVSHDCHKNKSLVPEDLRELQTLNTLFEAEQICTRHIGTTTILCRKHKFLIDLVCEKCSSIASGLRLNLLHQRMIEVVQRDWISPQTFWDDKTLLIPFDDALLAYIAKKSEEEGVFSVMERALVLAENIAIQGLDREWETIEIHAFDNSDAKAVRNLSMDPGGHEISGNQFYWMLRIENYCAPRFAASKRVVNDVQYPLNLGNVLNVLNKH